MLEIACAAVVLPSSPQSESYLLHLVNFPWFVEYNSPSAGLVWALGLILPWQTPGKNSWWGGLDSILWQRRLQVNSRCVRLWFGPGNLFCQAKDLFCGKAVLLEKPG